MGLRTSTYIHYHEAEQFLSGIKEFEALGKPVNTMVTINLDTGWLGIEPTECSKFARQSLQRLRVMYNRIECPWAAVWVLECKPIVGVHLHMLVHRSPDCQSDAQKYRQMLRKAFETNSYKAGTIRFCKFRTWYSSYNQNRDNLEKYLLKGIRPEIASEFGVKCQFQGKITGKRIGVLGC